MTVSFVLRLLDAVRSAAVAAGDIAVGAGVDGTGVEDAFCAGSGNLGAGVLPPRRAFTRFSAGPTSP